MSEVSCIRCRDRPMHFTGQFNVHGVATYGYHCDGCNGRVHLQSRRDQRTGQAHMVQVALNGSESEYRPRKLDPREELAIPVAYTLGDAPNRRTVQATPITTPEPAVRLDPRIDNGTMIGPDHPWHPANIRKRLQPVRLDELIADR